MTTKHTYLLTITLTVCLSTGYGFDLKSCIHHIPNFISMTNKYTMCHKLVEVQRKFHKHSGKYKHVPKKVVDKINQRIKDTANRQ